jgi:imidazolonepropionase-like amidohydrolase
MVADYLSLENCTLIDGLGGEPVEHARVLIQGERIHAAGPIDDTPLPPDARVATADLEGRWVMPGMIDCHFHPVYQDVTCWEDYSLRRSIEHTTILAARNAQTLLEVGFTSARDTGSRGLVSIAIRDMINAGVILGPRLQAGGRILTSTGGLADGFGSWVTNRADLGVVVDGVAAVVKEVREQIKYGATTIKVEASGTGISPYSNSHKQTMSTEEMAAAVNEAHRQGARVACHAQATESIKNAVRAGVDTVEHGTFLDEEGTQMMKDAGTILVPTVSVLYLYVHKGPEVGVPLSVTEEFRADLDDHMESVRMALDAGIPMATGSDSGHRFNPQSEIAYELDLMVQAGFTPMQAIQAATSVAARAIGQDADVGALTSGRYADLLVLASDPLEAVATLRDPANIERVYKGGRLVAGSAAPRRSELELGANFAPDPSEDATCATHQHHDGDPAEDRPCCLKTSDEIAEEEENAMRAQSEAGS